MKLRHSTLLVALILAAAVISGRAQEDGNKPGPTGQEGQAEAQSIETQPLPPSAYVDGERPPAKSRIYDEKLSRVWAAVLDALKRADVPIETSDEAAGAVQTKLILFEHTRFDNVATKPPIMTKEHPIGQIVRLNQGWFSVEIHLVKVKGGTQVEVRAYIEAIAADVLNQKRIHVERFSNGKIEDYFFAKIDESLK